MEMGGGEPGRAPTASLSARGAGVRSPSLTMCPNSADRRVSMMSLTRGIASVTGVLATSLVY